MAPNGVSHYAADYRLVECLRERYPPQLMPIQVSVWREFSSGLLERDLQIIASTGRGKTLSYTLPLLDALSKYTYRQDRALVIVPSGELANQVATVFHPFAEAISATADKLIRQQHQGWLAHTNSRLFVRNNPHIIPVGERARKKVRTFLVSATLCVHGTDAQRISTHALQNLEVLRLVLQLFKGQSVIIITSSVNSCCDIWQEIKTSQPSLLPVKYSSASSKSEQKASLEAFRNGSCKIMVASDAAARGLDVSGVKLVISYDVPDSAETYAHRVGRTARAGTDGIAMTFCRKSETEHYKKVTSFVNRHSPAVFLDVKDLFSNGISGAFSALLHHL
ncbi:P-loop containing nucleoside triphosphate hydrolase protein [Ostreococcus tauri]|uniref:P-loop containing nucleoside triphosphate hydrolase protein n=1 Tax=Ostreococcus tauri TaxID=70448 RepID=A0A1Y5HXV0_OSTTA|nr:P-loop containing nucleoside triphosphate hydrolase protein [Ostreococcus tauri]